MFFDTSDLKTDEIFLHLTKTSPAQPEKDGFLPIILKSVCQMERLSDAAICGSVITTKLI